MWQFAPTASDVEVEAAVLSSGCRSWAVVDGQLEYRSLEHYPEGGRSMVRDIGVLGCGSRPGLGFLGVGGVGANASGAESALEPRNFGEAVPQALAAAPGGQAARLAGSCVPQGAADTVAPRTLDVGRRCRPWGSARLRRRPTRATGPVRRPKNRRAAPAGGRAAWAAGGSPPAPSQTWRQNWCRQLARRCLGAVARSVGLGRFCLLDRLSRKMHTDGRVMDQISALSAHVRARFRAGDDRAGDRVPLAIDIAFEPTPGDG